VFPIARTIRSGNIPHLPTVYIVPSARSITVLIKSITIRRWNSVVRPISDLILLILKPKKKNHILIHSSALTVKVNTKQTTITVFSGNTNPIESGM